MKRSAPMKRTGFKRKGFEPTARPERVRAPTIPLTRPVVYARISQDVTAVPKENVARSERYLRLVASRRCIHCGIVGYSQAAHADYGKGGHIKSDDRTAIPLCTVHPGPGGRLVPGCHDLIGSGALFTKEERRALELRYAAQNRAEIEAEGLWPHDLERYPGDLVPA